MEKRIGIILVVTNERHNLKMLYHSLNNQSYNNFTIYFVDNNSNDGSYELSKELETQYSLNIKYVRLKENSGFAKGNNIGAEMAVKDGCEYFFILNNDIEADAKCLEELLLICENDSSIAATGPIVFYWNEEKQRNKIQEYGAQVDFKKYKVNKHYSNQFYEDIKGAVPDILEVDFVCGGAMFLRTEVYNKIGLWDERYFIYGDEIDFSKRAKQGNYKLFVTKKAKVWHNHKWVKSNKGKYYFEYFYTQRNKYSYLLKFKYYSAVFSNVLIEMLKFPKNVYWLSKLCDYKLVYFFYLGIISGLLGNRGKSKINFSKN